MNARDGTIRLATRGSDLAIRQAATVKERLEARRHTVELVEVETTGDQLRDELIHRLGKTGAFVRALDQQVLDGDCDAAVHSMKDVPTESPDDLVIAGVPERATPGDLLVTPDGATLDDLPEGSVVGTSSLRRKAELLATRPDLDVQPLRGNVDTRIEKLLAPHRQHEHERRMEAANADEEGSESGEGDGENTNDGNEDDLPEYDRTPQEWFDDLNEIERRSLERDVETQLDAIVLAAAGLERAGLARRVDTRELPTGEFVPAPGQGALAVTARDGELAETLNEVLDHPRTRVETTVERVVLEELGGGCVAPMGVHAVIQGEYVRVVVRVLSQDGSEEVAATRDLPIERHPTAARDFAGDLADRGAADLIEQAKRDEEEEAKRAE
ncbi:hydroxymethylbilane synthase [Halococcus saccharolyticus]|uniref:Hydroxymethylbilane synthase n=1 Tax=Halococcus saccharolyticus DSM 5350 TaxID=1227455 RepID=M0M9U1_9EURY|nr:hydroxymethylbilane synthase [Halococcus saccharolyticus]EMA42496.1 porphobilinogen deaminase [Halococcus saccharolyticus DSM 5350]